MITLFHAPKSRSSRMIFLLEELQVPYEIKLATIRRRDSGALDLLGERFSAADVLYGMTFALFAQSALLPKSPLIEQYVQRIVSRPAYARAQARDNG